MRNVWWTILVILALLAVFYAGRQSTRSDNAKVRDTITIYDTMRYIAPQVTARSRRLPPVSQFWSFRAPVHLALQPLLPLWWAQEKVQSTAF